MGATIWQKATATLAGVLSLAFTAWAGVVYSGWQDVRELLFDVSGRLERIEVTIENLATRQMDQNEDLDNHVARPWHDQAGNSISTMRLELDNLRERLHGHGPP